MTAYGSFQERIPYWDESQVTHGDCRGGGNATTGGAFQSSPISPQYFVATRTRYGSSLPNYKALIANAQSATTGFAATQVALRISPCIIWMEFFTSGYRPTCQYHRKRKAWWSGPVYVANQKPSLALSQKADNRARTAFYKKYENVLTSFSGGTALGELRETLHMIRNPAISIRKALGLHVDGLVKRRNLSKGERLKAASDGWLEFQFGIAPLVNDVRDAVGYLEKRTKQLSQEVIPISADGQANDITCTMERSNLLDSAFYIWYERRASDTVSVRYSGAIKASVTGTSRVNASSLGLAPRNFVPTIWELIPWSFAIDYFTNVGDVITAYSNGIASLAWGSKTTRAVRQNDCVGWRPQWPGLVIPVQQGFISGHFRSVNKLVSREQVAYVPLPDLAFELPGLGNKWVNLGALLASKRKLNQR